MSTIRIYKGKASSLELVETIECAPNRISSRKTVAGYLMFRLAVEDTEATPLTRYEAFDSERTLGGIYPVGLEKF